jgi:hypothetical protein
MAHIFKFHFNFPTLSFPLTFFRRAACVLRLRSRLGVFFAHHTADLGDRHAGSRNFTRRPLFNAELPTTTVEFLQSPGQVHCACSWAHKANFFTSSRPKR